MKHHQCDHPAAVDPAAALDRSLTQRLNALDQANLVRTQRAQLKKDLKGGRVSIQLLLLDPPAYIETAKVFDMLLAVPTYGRVKVNKALTACRISPSKTISGLSDRQRNELVDLLHDAPGHQLVSAGQETPRPASEVRPPAPEPAHDELLAHELQHLLGEARQVGRRAGQAAAEAGVALDGPSRPPDRGKLHAAVAQKVREAMALPSHIKVRVIVSKENVSHSACETATDTRTGITQHVLSPHLEALRRVDECRLARAELQRKISDGSITVAEVIITCPPEAANMTIAEVLTSQRRWGTTRCSKFLAEIGMPETKTIGSMSPRQRSVLSALIR